jgi:hypothetical protein
MAVLGILVVGSMLGSVGAVPAAFPTSGNGLWYDQPGTNWATQYLPIGNGYLGGAWQLFCPFEFLLQMMVGCSDGQWRPGV